MMPTTVTDAVAQFHAAIQSAGITPPAAIVADGKLHRFATNGKKGDDSGWYVFHGDGIPAGAFGDWRTGIRETWCAGKPQTMTETERHQLKARMAAIGAQRDAEEKQRHAEAAELAVKIWDSATEATDVHPYLHTKGVRAYGLRLDESGRLLIRVSINGKLTSLQRIAENGDKRFLTGGAIKGGSYTLGDPTKADITLIAEGYATAATLHEVTGLPVVMAFNVGNLEPVAKKLRAVYPTVTLVICADDDYQTPGNPGMTAATKVSQALNGLLAVPDFGPDRQEGMTDFNDLFRLKGPEAVQACIEAAMSRSKPKGHTVNVEAPNSNHSKTTMDEEAEDEVKDDASPSSDDLGEFPEAAWRGPFKAYRFAMDGTSEAPDTAHFTSLWAVAAACLHRRVHFHYGITTYPNVYLVNYGSTGDCKTTGMRYGLRLLPDQGVKVLRGVGSAEALGDWMQQPDEGKKVSHLLFIEELTTVLSRGSWEGNTLLSFLTETFDAPDRYEIPFRKKPVLVDEPTPTFIAGTTPEWLWKELREKDIHGGFGNRMFFLTGSPKAPIPLPAKPHREALAVVRTDLHRLLTLTPWELFFTPDAQALWKEFYFAWKKTAWPELTAAAVKRIPTYIVKLSMVYACLEQTSLITRDQLEAAILVGHYGAKCADRLMSRHRQVTAQGKCERRVLAVLEQHDLPSWKIHRQISGSFSAEELARALRALEATGVIHRVRETSRKEPIYGRRDRTRDLKCESVKT